MGIFKNFFSIFKPATEKDIEKVTHGYTVTEKPPKLIGRFIKESDLKNGRDNIPEIEDKDLEEQISKSVRYKTCPKCKGLGLEYKTVGKHIQVLLCPVCDAFPYKDKKIRPSWNEYFMSMAELAASRSTCLRAKVGAVLVKRKQILATGYNNPPIGMPHCKVCIRNEQNIPSGQRHELCRSAHAEQNVIAQAARHGICIDGSTLYCTVSPCSICLKILMNAGIRKIYYKKSYPDKLAKTLLDEFNKDCNPLRLEVIKLEDQNEPAY